MLLETWEKVAIFIGVILSVCLFSFLLSWFAVKKIFRDKSHKRIKILSWLTTAILAPAALYLIAYLIFTPRFLDLKDSLDGWEIKTTYQIYPSKSISIIDKRFKMNSGENNVLIVSKELTPVVKKGETEPTDLRSTTNLIIELSPTDTFINPGKLGSSKILREVLAFSPDYGTSPLDKEEKIEIKKIGENRWEIVSDLIDFQFNGQFSFIDSSRVTNKYVDEW
jgi:hypothetical protein